MAVTLGSQVQADSYAGAGVQPTARVMWKALPRQRIWGAASRALRTPSYQERGLRLDYPPVPSGMGLPLVVTVLGNPEARTENFVDAEAGYRLEIGTAASIDVTGFVGRYDHLSTTEQAAPIVQFAPVPQILVTSQFANALSATTRGLEVAGHWIPVRALRLEGSYTAIGVASLATVTQIGNIVPSDWNTPRTQWKVRSAFSPGTRATFDVAIFRVGQIEPSQVDAYTRADVSGEWRFNRRLSVRATGQNLLDAAHAEFSGTGAVLQGTQVPRSGSLRLRWTF
jgi:iron complex outermembrane receptor protein